MSKPDTENTKEATTTATEAATAESGLIAKLKKHKAAKSGTDSTVLPDTGITVTWPQFKPHGIWMKATRLAKGDPQGAMNIYLPLLCRFDGEQMTVAEFKDLVPTDDVLHLFGNVMGRMATDDDGDDDAGDPGNALH